MDGFSFATLAAWAGPVIPLLGGIAAAYRFWLRKRLETLRQNDETAHRYRQLWEDQRAKFQSDIMAAVEQMRQENMDLRKQLYASEQEKLNLITQIAKLQAQVIGLEHKLKLVTEELIQLRGAQPDATPG